MSDANIDGISPWMMVAVRPRGRRVIVVGGGTVACRRAEQFLARGAEIEMFDPWRDETCSETSGLISKGLKCHRREVSRIDLQNTWLVIVATNDPETNRKVGKWADELGIACNRTDDAEAGTFAVPAIMEDDLGWKVAVLGGDAGPLFSAWVKGLVGQMAASERIGQVYTTMASARYAAETLPLSQQERALLLRNVMARVLESTEDIDGAAVVRQLHADRSTSSPQIM